MKGYALCKQEFEDFFREIAQLGYGICFVSHSAEKTIKDEKVLNEIADLYADGDFATAIDKQNEYLAKYHGELEKTIKADLMKQNPQPQPQNGNGGITKEQFDAMGVQERTKLYNEQPEVYKQFTQ